VFCAPESIRIRFKDRPKTGLVSEAANISPIFPFTIRDFCCGAEGI
jgi:hypothetical protein